MQALIQDLQSAEHLFLGAGLYMRPRRTGLKAEGPKRAS